MAPKYKLTYFSLKALAEPIRYILAYGGQEYEDERIEFSKWGEVKDIMPFGKVPLLEVDSKKIHQSMVICRYLAKQFKLMGSNDWEATQVDMISETIKDFREPVFEYNRLVVFGGRDKEEIAKKKETLVKETLPYYLKKFDAIVSANQGYFVAGKLTWADLFFAALLDSVSGILEGDILKNYSNLKALTVKVYALPSIKKWMEKRPVSQF